ncbi:MAG: acetylornithine/succinylornithine family transaminase [Chloroflexi bacterium]|nr:acetylornithine/succinylornithine family transaminase [Chloroflexota bacterium]
MDSITRENRYTSGVYPKRELALVRGEGATVWDEAGRSYIDCVGGHGVAIVGHCHPQVSAAICAQAQRLITCPEIFYNDVRAQLEERLCQIAPAGLEHVYLCNSGTEAVEAAFKFARLATGRTGIVAAMRSFHGRTMGALSATWEPNYRTPFNPLLPDVQHVPYNKLSALDDVLDDSTAALILEVVQGEGGVNLGDADYLRGAQALCRERGVLLIIDEVQTGFGRTGKLWACEHAGLQPDLLCCAKGIAGGVPMGAVLLGERVINLRPGVHGSTFGGNPLACAASLAAIAVITGEDLPGMAAAKGTWLLERLRKIEAPLIREVRGLGLIVGIELRQKATPYLKALMTEGLLALPAGSTVIRLLPPLVISQNELERASEIIERVLTV